MINTIVHRETITKEELSKLPSETFKGSIYVIQTTSEAEKAIDVLKECPIIGFDTETKPSHKKGVTHTISLVQLSTDSICFLFRTIDKKMLDYVKIILEDEKLLKIGLSLKDDLRGLHKLISINPINFIELQTYVKSFGIADNGLSKIYADLFDLRISKSQRLSNWEADFLSTEQKKYAALDAWATRRIYVELETYKQANNNQDKIRPTLTNK